MNDIIKQYEMMRDKANEEQQERLDILNKNLEGYADIENEIRMVGLKSMRLAAMGKFEDAEALKEKIKKLSLKKQELLKINGISEEYLKPQFNCKSCSDEGFVKVYDADGNLKGSEMCNCFKQKLIEKRYANSGMGEKLKTQTFETFNIDIFEGEQKNMMTEMYKLAVDYAENFEKQTKGLVFMGTTGTGKTFLSSCIAKTVMDNGYTVIYQTVRNILNTASEAVFNKNDSYMGTTSQVLNAYNDLLKCDLLIIDDLGTEMINTFTVAEMFNIINERSLRNKKTIISTNLTLRQIQEYYNDRFKSRLFEGFDFYKFVGADLRVEEGLRRRGC